MYVFECACLLRSHYLRACVCFYSLFSLALCVCECNHTVKKRRSSVGLRNWFACVYHSLQSDWADWSGVVRSRVEPRECCSVVLWMCVQQFHLNWWPQFNRQFSVYIRPTHTCMPELHTQRERETRRLRERYMFSVLSCTFSAFISFSLLFTRTRSLWLSCSFQYSFNLSSRRLLHVHCTHQSVCMCVRAKYYTHVCVYAHAFVCLYSHLVHSHEALNRAFRSVCFALFCSIFFISPLSLAVHVWVWFRWVQKLREKQKHREPSK